MTTTNKTAAEEGNDSTGMFESGNWRVVETKPDVPEWEQVKKTKISKNDARQYAKNLNEGPSGQAGYIYEAEPIPTEQEGR